MINLLAQIVITIYLFVGLQLAALNIVMSSNYHSDSKITIRAVLYGLTWIPLWAAYGLIVWSIQKRKEKNRNV